MDAMVSKREVGVPFKSPRRFLADLDVDTMAKVIECAADIALIIENGIIVDIALGTDDLAREPIFEKWVKKSWAETVTIESRPKLEKLLDASAAEKGTWRQVNHPSAAGADIPIKYITVGTGVPGRMLALGRDLRTIATLQQRLVEAHQELERDYSKLREAQARYRLVFDQVQEPIFVVDAADLSIVEMNAPAKGLLAKQTSSSSSNGLQKLFAKEQWNAITQHFAKAIVATTPISLKGLLADKSTKANVTVSAFRDNSSTLMIVRLGLLGEEDSSTDKHLQTAFLSVLDEMPDAIVLVSSDLRLMGVNKSFLDMVQLLNEAQVEKYQLGDFLGRSETDINLLISNVTTHRHARNFSTVLRDRFGVEEAVEVSAVAVPFQESELIGLSIRSVARRLRAGPRLNEELPTSADQLTDLVGRLPLKEIVRESADLIERLCIEAALEITGDNRASAAEMLGLSRQGLYSKLKRFGFDD
ncbi:MAG: transcriptional regulator PpsR [Pseudomonadota bacterium]